MGTNTVKICIGNHVRKHTASPLQNTTTSHVELSHFCRLLYCKLYLFWVHLQEVTTSDFSTYTVLTHHVEPEEHLLARVMAAAEVVILCTRTWYVLLTVGITSASDFGNWSLLMES